MTQLVIALTPDPGSPEARQQGCRASASDNRAGTRRGHAGVHPDNGWPHAEWIVRSDCRLHWRCP